MNQKKLSIYDDQKKANRMGARYDTTYRLQLYTQTNGNRDGSTTMALHHRLE
jgi:hypothetical protein